MVAQKGRFARVFAHPEIHDSIQELIWGYQQKAAHHCWCAAQFAAK
jgi:hypothetical protein